MPSLLWPFKGILGIVYLFFDVSPACPLLVALNGEWLAFLGRGLPPAKPDGIRKHERTGLSLGNTSLVSQLEHLLGRELRPRKPGGKQEKSKNQYTVPGNASSSPALNPISALPRQPWMPLRRTRYRWSVMPLPRGSTATGISPS